MEGDNGDSVVISARAFVTMTRHAGSHMATAVHGILIGSRSGNEIQISDVFPVCHETPTSPLVETALALVKSDLGDSTKQIVGWYTAPEILADDRPGPVALKIVASLRKELTEPILLVVHNQTIGRIIHGEATKASTAVQAFGKNFRKQWMEPLGTTVLQDEAAAKAAKDLHGTTTAIIDLVDHWGVSTSSSWLGSESMAGSTNDDF